jgi:hypothetical protein
MISPGGEEHVVPVEIGLGHGTLSLQRVISGDGDRDSALRALDTGPGPGVGTGTRSESGA